MSLKAVVFGVQEWADGVSLKVLGDLVAVELFGRYEGTH